MKRNYAVALVGLALATFLAARWQSSAAPQAAATQAGRRMIPALSLPRSGAVPAHIDVSQLAWREGLLQAASMYFPSEAMVFEVIPSPPTRDTVSQLASSLGAPLAPDQQRALAEDEGGVRGGYITVTPGSLHLSCFSDGNYSASWRDRHPSSELPPLGKEAVGISETIATADAFTKETSLLPEGSRLVEVVPMLTREHQDEDGVSRQYVLTRGAVYRRFHGGFPEGTFVVEVNDEGEVCAVSRNMRDLRPIASYPILSPEEARAALGSDAGRIEGLTSLHSYHDLSIDAVQMEYWSDARGAALDVLQPVYKFQATAIDEGGRAHAFAAQVPAVRPEYTEAVALPR